MSRSDPEGSSDPDEFDRIVEHLDLDLSFPDTEPEPRPTTDEPTGEPPESHERWTRGPSEPDDEDEPFYRRVEPSARPWRLGISLAWFAVLGGPLALVLCTMSGYIVPRSMLAALVLLFVAGAIYLFSQLPERGPADPDAPDDGAVL